MSATAYDEVWTKQPDGTMVLISRTPRTIDDATIFRQDAPVRLRQAYTALRQWSQDAQTEVAAWDAQTAVQRNAALKVTIQRFGVLCDGLADLLMQQSLDQ